MPKYDWVSLSAFFYSMQDDRRYRYLPNREQVMVNMLASRMVPVRSMVAGQLTYRAIEPYLTHSMHFHILSDSIDAGIGAIEVVVTSPLDRLTLWRANPRPVICERVQLDRTAAKAWLDDYALETGASQAFALPPAKTTRRGPAPGTVDRYRQLDRRLIPEMRSQIRAGATAWGAACALAEAGKVAGHGGPESKAKRLLKRFNEERGKRRLPKT
jgi:hypothetical protein